MVNRTGWAPFEGEVWECADFVGTQKDPPDSLTKGFSDRAINDEIDGGVENEEKVVERDQNQECDGVR